MVQTKNLHVRSIEPLRPPKAVCDALPCSETVAQTVADCREAIIRILAGDDPRLLVVVGPCSIHDPQAAMDYARRLAALRIELADRMEIVMRVYFEKPRTTIGWKGLINDPDLNGTCEIDKGLSLARKLLLDIVGLGLPAATEFLDPIVPQYLADLIAWTAIGARTTESQTHREMASGLSMPVGFKNSTDGSLQVAIDALAAVRHPHHFLGVDEYGFTSIVRTSGNPAGHLVLRGGSKRPNYDAASIQDALQRLARAGLPQALMVDCSHGNSGKVPARQEVVWRDVLEQRATGTRAIIGLMLESNIHEGNQPFPQPLAALRYGVSITDPCISWETTERLLRWGAQRLGQSA